MHRIQTRLPSHAYLILQVAALPSDKSIVDMADSFFTKKVFLTLAGPEPEPEPNP